MHREVNHGPTRRRHVGLHGVAIALQCRQRALWTILKDGVKPLLENHNLITRGAHLCHCLTNNRKIDIVDWRSLFTATGIEKHNRRTN